MKREYTVEEIADHPEFTKWMTTDTMDISYWEGYAAHSPTHFRKVQEAIDLYNLRNGTDHLIETHRIETSKKHLIDDITTRDRQRKFRQTGLLTVLCFLIVFSGCYYMNRDTSNPVTDDSTLTDQENISRWTSVDNMNSSRIKSVLLPDNSYVFLDPGSSIRFAKERFEDHRVIHLRGGGFFMVESRQNKKFIVLSDEFQTTVLGTEFYINDQNENEESYVQVTDGKVRVQRRKPESAASEMVVLTKMESLHLDKSSNKIRVKKEKLNEAVGVRDIHQSITYRDTPVSIIFNDLARRFSIEINFDEELLKDCTITATFDNKKLDQVLYIICKILNASFRQHLESIEIYSKGC